MQRKTFHSIRALRLAHRLSTTELGRRLGVYQSTIVRLERSESIKTASLATLNKAALAMGYRLEYAFVPETKDARGSRTASKLSRLMQDEDRSRALQMSPIERVHRALELSDLARELKNVPKST